MKVEQRQGVGGESVKQIIQKILEMGMRIKKKKLGLKRHNEP